MLCMRMESNLYFGPDRPVLPVGSSEGQLLPVSVLGFRKSRPQAPPLLPGRRGHLDRNSGTVVLRA